MKSYKPYARLISALSAVVIVIASLDASQVINIVSQYVPQYAGQVNSILVIAGLIAPIIAQEKRVVRAEELAVENVDTEEITVPINVNMDTEDIVSTLKEYIDESSVDEVVNESDASSDIIDEDTA